MGECDEAIKTYKRALSIATEDGNDAEAANILYSLGNLCTLHRRVDDAVEYFTRHLSLTRRLKDADAMFRAHWSLVNCYYVCFGFHST